MMNVLRTAFLFLNMTLATTVFAAGGPAINVEMPPIDPENQASLQRGAKYFVNYCSGCHSLEYVRFNRLAKDIGITDDQGNILEEVLKKDLMFTTDKVGDTLQVAMPEAEAKKWFGVAPPDLTLEEGLRGAEWIYGFLTTFYSDPSAPWGVNNLVYPGTAMPNILGALQGEQRPIYKTHTVAMSGAAPIQEKVVVGVEQATPGTLTPEEFNQVAYDIVNFLAYTADPGKIERQRLGVYVLLFIALFILFTYLLKREYWRDVH
jgi:ubiquinol-cytochrome c reductase cytochrome c1 subunit